jgi:hypothetical protein
MLQKIANFQTDYQDGIKGEFASLSPMALHMQKIIRVELDRTDGPSPDDFRIFVVNGLEFSVDVKTDWWALKRIYATHNVFFEPASQVERGDLSRFPDCDIARLFGYDKSGKAEEAKCVLDTIMSRLVSGESSGLPKKRDGWGIKDLDHLVIYWCVTAPGGSFKGKEAVIKKQTASAGMSKEGIDAAGLSVLREQHDAFMDEMNISAYVMYVMDKTVLLDYIKKNYKRYSARVVPNPTYTTIGYLVPMSEIDTLAKTSSKHVKRYAWRV